ncbi:Fc.00g063620.m01.CDS01 [Cosmosporella sp. VM-42]
MGSALLQKRSFPLLPTFSIDSVDAPTAPSSLPCSGDRGSPVDLHVLKLRDASSKVWSDIRGAIKAIGRSSRGASQGSTILDFHSGTDSPQQPPKGKAVAFKGDEGSDSPSRKGKGIAPRDLIRKLRLNNLGLASNSTIVLGDTPGSREGSPKALASLQSSPFTESDSPPSTGESSKLSTAADDSTRKTSVDSRFSVLTKDTTKRRHSRRQPWTRSSPEGGTLGTINESGVDHAQPTIETVERAAAAGIYLETYFNELLNAPNMRAVRRQYLETQLYYSPHLTPDQKQAIRGSFYNQETWHLRETRMMKSRALRYGPGEDDNSYLDNYEPLKVLGKGSFGVVRLVREKHAQEHTFSRQVYAMKVIKKNDMLRSSQEGHLRAERDALVASEGANWIVPLIASFQDPYNLYLVMEYMPGGDFLGLLIRENILHEAVARFYIAEMILAVEEAHRLKFIHRDIKPDNFLISATGHLKISDFGLAFDGHWSHDASYYNYHRYNLVRKLGIKVAGDDQDQKEAKEFSTQLEWYQAITSGFRQHEKQPSRDYDLENLLDWRNRCGTRAAANSVSIGIILYECLYGHTPFLAEEGRKETKQNILQHKTRFYFPQRPIASDKCKDLIFRLIQDKEFRICSKRYQIKDRGGFDGVEPSDFFGRYVFPDDAEDIKAHRWFKSIPWDRLQTLTPPFVPRIDNAEDTHYFDESEPITDWSESSPDHPGITPDDVKQVLCDFRISVQNVALELVKKPYDSTMLRKMDRKIDTEPWLAVEEKEVLKHFVRLYGKKDRKRARDRLLRDDVTKDVVMDIRKRTAFLGYTWRRMRPGGYVAQRATE